MYKLDPTKFLLVPGLTWEAAFKKTHVKSDPLFDITMLLLMVEKGIRGGICHSIYRYAKANNKYMKVYDKIKESSYIQYWDVKQLYVWAMSHRLLLNNFEWIRDNSQFNEDFIKTIMQKMMKNIFLKLMFNILKNYMNFIMIYYFYQK